MDSKPSNSRVVVMIIFASLGGQARTEAATGACCKSDGTCDDNLTADVCYGRNTPGSWTWLFGGEGSSCSSPPNRVCRGPFGGCRTDLSFCECLHDDIGSFYIPSSSVCDAPVQGTCCLPPGCDPEQPAEFCCDATFTEFGCEHPFYGGAWGGGAQCDPNNVCPTGACCDQSGVLPCDDTGNALECANQNRIWIRDHSVCLPGGACPIPTLSQWGAVVLALLVVTLGTLVIEQRRRETG